MIKNRIEAKININYLQPGIYLSIFIKMNSRIIKQPASCKNSYTMMHTFFFRCTLIIVFAVPGHFVLAQSSLLPDNDRYTISKRFLSIENGLASPEVCFQTASKSLNSIFLFHGTKLHYSFIKVRKKENSLQLYLVKTGNRRITG